MEYGSTKYLENVYLFRGQIWKREWLHIRGPTAASMRIGTKVVT